MHLLKISLSSFFIKCLPKLFLLATEHYGFYVSSDAVGFVAENLCPDEIEFKKKTFFLLFLFLILLEVVLDFYVKFVNISWEKYI